MFLCILFGFPRGQCSSVYRSVFPGVSVPLYIVRFSQGSVFLCILFHFPMGQCSSEYRSVFSNVTRTFQDAVFSQTRKTGKRNQALLVVMFSLPVEFKLFVVKIYTHSNFFLTITVSAITVNSFLKSFTSLSRI